MRTRERYPPLVPDLRLTRWSGKSDYYSLFLVLDAHLQRGRFRPARLKVAQKAMATFASAVSQRLSKGGGTARVSRVARVYASAVEKAASDKDRRARRHDVLTVLLAPYFEPTRGAAQ